MERRNSAHELVVESITGALLILMERKPFESINISELCEKAGVSRASFYRNFKTKDDILIKHLKRLTDDWWIEFEKKSPDEFYATFWTELLEQYRKNKKVINLIKQNNLSHILKEHIFLCCGPKPEQDEKTAFICAAIAGAIYGYVDEWLNRGMDSVPPQISFRNMLSVIE